MAFNGSGVGTGGGNGGGSGSGGDGPLNKRLCTGKENNEAGLNNNRVSSPLVFIPIKTNNSDE